MSTSQWGMSDCLSRTIPCHMRLRPLGFVVWQVDMDELLINYRRNNNDRGTVACTNVASLGPRSVSVTSNIGRCAARPSTLHMTTVVAPRTATEVMHSTLVTAPFRMFCDYQKTVSETQRQIAFPSSKHLQCLGRVMEFWPHFMRR